ncbi:hypothetical protein [Streptomyces bluensis]|uniref:hypothetical protein n=1 Tax=Streptomyces bluensis TaxID=33897 RepID=UPI003EBCAB6A
MVGVDPDPARRLALAWAADEADRCGLPLRLVHGMERSPRTPLLPPLQIHQKGSGQRALARGLWPGGTAPRPLPRHHGPGMSRCAARGLRRNAPASDSPPARAPHSRCSTTLRAPVVVPCANAS